VADALASSAIFSRFASSAGFTFSYYSAGKSFAPVVAAVFYSAVSVLQWDARRALEIRAFGEEEGSDRKAVTAEASLSRRDENKGNTYFSKVEGQ